jgi:uncharacterized protein (DUF58 family)
MYKLEGKVFREFGNLELLAKQVVEGFIIGKHKSPFHGFSAEFAEHRIYNPGESTKYIDWKVYARTERMFTKKYEEETNLRCQLVVDASSSMAFPYQSNSINKLQYAALGAASIMYLLQKQRDAFGLSLFDEDLIVNTQSKSNTTHFKMLVSQLENKIQKLDLLQKTNTSAILHQIADLIHKRSLVVIFSDMFSSNENPNDLFSALQHLKYNKHEVLLFHVLDQKSEISFDFENRPYLFVDLETGDEVKLQSSRLKEVYAQKMETYMKNLKDKCMQFGIDLIEADISSGFGTVLQNYLVKRNKMGK